MRSLPWSRRIGLRLGGEPWTEKESAAVAAYVERLSGPRLLIWPAFIGLAVFLVVLLAGPLLQALGMGMVALTVVLGMTLVARQQASKHVGGPSTELARKQAITALLTVTAALGLGAGTLWLTHTVTMLVTDDLLPVVSDVDQQWWGRINTVVVPEVEQVPMALGEDRPDILLLTGADDRVAEAAGPGSVVAHRQGDPSAVVTLHLTNAKEPTEDVVQQLLMDSGPGPDAFRRAGFVYGQADRPD